MDLLVWFGIVVVVVTEIALITPPIRHEWYLLLKASFARSRHKATFF